MREILFRGKRTDDGKWVEGFYLQMPNACKEDGNPLRHYIDDYPCCNLVNPETVGQFTGLCDKNGNRIFEGDIVSALGGKTFEIKFEDGCFYLNGTAIAIHHATRFKIIGNRWDNPELVYWEKVAGGEQK